MVNDGGKKRWVQQKCGKKIYENVKECVRKCENMCIQMWNHVPVKLYNGTYVRYQFNCGNHVIFKIIKQISQFPYTYIPQKHLLISTIHMKILTICRKHTRWSTKTGKILVSTGFVLDVLLIGQRKEERIS